MKSRFHTLAMSGIISILVGGLGLNIPEASAHENKLYNIGNKDYWITVGSINEPVFVDDKSGAEVFIKAADTSSPLDSNARQ